MHNAPVTKLHFHAPRRPAPVAKRGVWTSMLVSANSGAPTTLVDVPGADRVRKQRLKHWFGQDMSGCLKGEQNLDRKNRTLSLLSSV